MKRIEKVLEKQRNSVKVLCLVGEPGVGKSQLARKHGVNYASRTLSTSGISTKTVLTLDMNDFRANYCKLASKLGLSQNVIDSQSLNTIAEEMKKILSTRNHWMLIIDNYNSINYEGFEKSRHNYYHTITVTIVHVHAWSLTWIPPDENAFITQSTHCIVVDLLPLHGSTGEWGSGTVLVTTNNAKVVPISHTSKVTVGPLSMKESSKLIGQTAGYTLSSGEEVLLKSTVEKHQWRLIPLVMARWDARN